MSQVKLTFCVLCLTFYCTGLETISKHRPANRTRSSKSNVGSGTKTCTSYGLRAMINSCIQITQMFILSKVAHGYESVNRKVEQFNAKIQISSYQ
jgi:hypothetical protein